MQGGSQKICKLRCCSKNSVWHLYDRHIVKSMIYWAYHNRMRCYCDFFFSDSKIWAQGHYFHPNFHQAIGRNRTWCRNYRDIKKFIYYTRDRIRTFSIKNRKRPYKAAAIANGVKFLLCLSLRGPSARGNPCTAMLIGRDCHVASLLAMTPFLWTLLQYFQIARRTVKRRKRKSYPAYSRASLSSLVIARAFGPWQSLHCDTDWQRLPRRFAPRNDIQLHGTINRILYFGKYRLSFQTWCAILK